MVLNGEYITREGIEHRAVSALRTVQVPETTAIAGKNLGLNQMAETLWGPGSWDVVNPDQPQSGNQKIAIQSGFRPRGEAGVLECSSDQCDQLSVQAPHYVKRVSRDFLVPGMRNAAADKVTTSWSAGNRVSYSESFQNQNLTGTAVQLD